MTVTLAVSDQLSMCFAPDVYLTTCDDIYQAHAGTDGKFPYPIIADPDRDLAVKFGMLDPVEKDAEGMPMTCRAVRCAQTHSLTSHVVGCNGSIFYVPSFAICWL